MQIPQELPRFDIKTLLIITGSQYAKFYYAHKDEILEITEFKTPTPTYTDREGFFMSSGNGLMYGAGSVYEENGEYIKINFLNSLNSILKAISQEIDVEQIILFSPSYVAPDIKENIIPSLKERISDEFHGNYTKLHPTELLSLIQKRV